MGSQGSIITRVYTSDAFIPLHGATVLYTTRLPDGTERLLSVKITDSSGLTAAYYTDTPEKIHSLHPGDPQQPFTRINIRVSLPGYESAVSEGVQIFPDVQTIQGFQLRPVASHSPYVTTVPQSSQNL